MVSIISMFASFIFIASFNYNDFNSLDPKVLENIMDILVPVCLAFFIPIFFQFLKLRTDVDDSYSEDRMSYDKLYKDLMLEYKSTRNTH